MKIFNHAKLLGKLTVLVVAVLLLVTSCSKSKFLEETTTTNLNEQTVFSDSAYVMSFLSNIYSKVGFSFNPVRFNDNGGLDAASSEADVPRVGVAATSTGFADGSITPATVMDDAWKTCYSQIRAVNLYLKHSTTLPFAEFLRKRTAAEARFLRAWYYFTLLKHYGGVPLVGDSIFSDNQQITASRNSFEECVNYIVAECNAAATDLPVRQQGLEYGRAGAGACLALKARVLLYAASPLFNGNNAFNTGVSEPLRSIVGYNAASNERWKLAADAARMVISLGTFTLYNTSNQVSGVTIPPFRDMFYRRVNSEYIFARMQNGTRDFESVWMPPSRGGDGHGAYPYQELVDAFPMIDGKLITDANSGYNASRPYDNRDPRLEHTIMHDSSLIVLYTDFIQPIMGQPLKLYVDAGADAVFKRTTTGYYVNKMLKPDLAGNSIHGAERCWPLLRLGEMYLDFAEAENEYLGPTQEVYDAIIALRKRAGILPGSDNLYGLTVGLSKDEMREIIRNERRVELAFEEHWFWDVRRWMIAANTENTTMHGMKVTRNSGSAPLFEVFNVRKRNFRNAMYLFPVPQSEVAKSEFLLQNPYWSTTSN
ncbi:RagB/SusD family nutrient uptake outer membrane protein [Niabella ginsengisoli]|uniref:RagB/SusD family nutrient uptake outer membrane protein n=1 Tax=Niabella ginsengisoli TaxID=522298 RepID=A0ABS9SDQ1_9BACT|nr:RagB/SusD family nutrient uptake outer membrane protein [Niabella ginsengisoli]MCH5596475.1 RagB/SusD family nutrient uptake outer membrane protein [Niabella ginsengisoli]